MWRKRTGQFAVAACRCYSDIVIRLNYRSVAFLCALVALGLCAGGCSAWFSRAGTENLSFERMLSVPYDGANLKTSLTLDVLGTIHRSQGKLAPYFTGAELLSGYRGAEPISVPALTRLMLAFSALVMDLENEIESIDLNPVKCTGKRCVVADARIMLNGPHSQTDFDDAHLE